MYHRPSKNWRSPAVTERRYLSVSSAKRVSDRLDNFPQMLWVHLLFERSNAASLSLRALGRRRIRTSTLDVDVVCISQFDRINCSNPPFSVPQIWCVRYGTDLCT